MSRFSAQQVANLRSWGYVPRPDEIIEPPQPPAPMRAWNPEEANADYRRMLNLTPRTMSAEELQQRVLAMHNAMRGSKHSVK